MTTYEPGTVAMVTVADGTFRALRCGLPANMGWEIAKPTSKYWISDKDGSVTDVRPLVVLDLTEYSTAPLVAEHLREMSDTCSKGKSRACSLGHFIADQIEQQTRPAKPSEPTGLGAVVEDTHGESYVLVGATELDEGDPTWVCTRTGGFFAWAALPVVRVCSEGWSA